MPEIKKPAASMASGGKNYTPNSTSAPPAQLMNLVETFLSENDFADAHREFQKQRANKGWKDTTSKSASNDSQILAALIPTWETSLRNKASGRASVNEAAEEVTKVSSSSEDSDSDDECSDSSSSASHSESGGEEDMELKNASTKVPEKVKQDASTSFSSSSSESDSSDDSDSESEAEKDEKVVLAAPQAIPLKRMAKSSSVSESDSSSDSESDSTSSSEDDAPPFKKQKVKSDSATDSSDSELGSDSESDSDDPKSESAAEVKKAADTALPNSSDASSESDSHSDSDSDSSSTSSSEESDDDLDSEAESEGGNPITSEKNKNAKKLKKEDSDSSVTLGKTSPKIFPVSTLAPLPPEPVNYCGKGGQKKASSQHFSRISKDIKVDPRFASNEFAGHEWGQRAHEDLMVIKGKGFTKEKNKKKRGRYQGGRIDAHARGGIKFDD